MTDLSPLAEKHLKQIASFYDTAKGPSWAGRQYRQMLAYYYNRLIPALASVLEVGCADGYLIELLHGESITGVDVSARQVERAKERVPNALFHAQAGEKIDLDTAPDSIVLSDTINTAADVQRLFARLHMVAHPKTRLILNFHNTLWRPLFSLACLLGLKRKEPESSWLAGSDVCNLLARIFHERVY